MRGSGPPLHGIAEQSVKRVDIVLEGAEPQLPRRVEVPVPRAAEGVQRDADEVCGYDR